MSDAKEILAQRRALEHSQNLKAQMEARGAAIDQLGQKLGEPVDFSNGIDLGPPPAAKTGTSKAPIRPNVVIPKPPEMTRAEEEELTKSEAQREREEYEAAFRDAGHPLPPPANPADFRAKKTLPKRDTSRVQHKKPPHPLLAQLRHEFGIGSDEKPPIDVKVADHIWTFIPLTPDLISLAARAADVLSETVSEHTLRAKQASVCFSIVAIDSIPVWMVLGFEPSEDDNVSFPLLPRGPIRKNSALALYAELTGAMKNRLLDALYEAYLAKVDPEGSVASYTSYENTEHVVWVCSEPDCDHKFSKPKRFDADGQELPYFCELHGTEMLNISTTKPRIDEDLRPLR